MFDGLHVSSAALSWDSQILLNLYCNEHMNFNDGTCCTTTEPASVFQLAMLLVFTARSAPEDPLLWITLHASEAAMRCIVIGPVCLWVCCHNNSKLRASIITKLGL